MTWPTHPIGKVILSSQYGLSIPAHSEGHIPMVGMKGIQGGRVHIDDTICVSLSDEELDTYRIRKGDILLNRTNSPDLVGKTGLALEDMDAVFASYLVRIMIDKSKADPEFINYCMNSETGQRQMKTLSTRAISQANINPTTFKQHFRIPLPPIAVQHEIASFIRSWDTAIEKMERLMAAKRLKHAALSSRLLRKESRELSFISFVKPAMRESAKPNEAYWALGIRSHCKGTFRRYVEDPSTVAMDTLYRVKHDDIIVNITFAWEGAIALVDKADEDCFVSHRFPTFEIDRNKALPDFLRHVIVQKRFVRNLGLISPGGAGRNRVLNKKDFLKLKVALPHLEKQQLIGSTLNTSLREISILQTELTLLKKQKSGLMQKLLTGEWRVKAGGEVS